MSLSYRNHSIDLQDKSMDWFLYDRDLRHERVTHHILPKLNAHYEKIVKFHQTEARKIWSWTQTPKLKT